ncbi:single-stranded DNA-binding protein [bacterium]|nr:single-stranded DNA-binding protein [bacterium]
MAIAKAVVTGTVYRNPEKRYTSNNVPVSAFVLNIGDKEELLIRVLAKRNSLDEVVSGLSKGVRVLVEGRLQTNNVKNENGTERKIFEIDANAIELMGEASSVTSDFSEDIVKFADTELGDELIGEDEIPF